MFVGNPAGAMVAFAYISFAAIIILFLLSQVVLASKRFRDFLYRRKIMSAFVILVLMTLSWPVFTGVNRHYEQYTQLKNKCDSSFGYHKFEKNTTVDGLSFPKGTKLKFTKISFPHETLYQGLSVMSVEAGYTPVETVEVELSKPQIIEGWECAPGSLTRLNFKKNEGYQLQGCTLLDGNEISGINLPRSQLYRSGSGEQEWHVRAGNNLRWNDEFVELHGLKFTSFDLGLTPDRKQTKAFEGILGETVTIKSRDYVAGDTLTLEELQGYIETVRIKD